MATIKSFTSLEQSMKLAEILPLESADYFHAPDAGIVVTEPYKLNEGDETVITAYKGAIPCWSLTALFNILPNENMLVKTTNGEYYCLSKDVMTKHYGNPVDACVTMIEKLHKLKIF